MKKTKTSLLHSGLALLLCISMLIGSTFAWFSESISSGKNIITAGNLDLEMYWTDDLDSGEWHNVEENGHNTIFNYDNWEPGYTNVKYIKLVNAGDLALNYKLSLTPQNGVGKLAEVINVYFAEGGVAVEQRSDLQNLQAIGLLKSVLNGGSTADGTLLAADQYSPLHPSGEVIMTLAMNMLTTAGNEYQNEDAGMFSITALATQASFEKDSFGSDYDVNATFPTILTSGSASADVTPADGKVPTGGVALTGGNISAFVPEGVVLEDGVKELTLTVTPLKNTTSDITTVNNEILIPVDVHIEGVAEDNTVPIVIDLGEILPKYLNMGNYHLYHIEDGVNNEMTLVDSKAALTAHNQFTYDTLTGAVSVAMASFSEVALVADTSMAWKGEEDYTWYNTTDTNFYIANADQLHAFAKIVGGMAVDVTVNDEKTTFNADSFSDKTVILLSDINLNNGTVLDNADGTTKTIFYPIGYRNNKNFTSANEVNRPTEAYTDVTSDVCAFEGTFDGNGHTIANFYQNTWEMFGDYNSGYPANSNYYKDAMGLFAWVDGTVKNLTVDNFKSDGEFTPTGVIAAYAGYNGNATFENIAITNCNPRVYNTGNGGIVGIGGNEEKENAIAFKNITIDNSNKITALWGSWDVACGGLMGMFRGKDSETAVVTMNNCHVAAQIDVYNDVCGNYQYYWYRYSGMLVGTNYNMTTENGYTVPNTKQYSAENCTVHFGDWNDYYYCELVANSLASYTHDHQFSRLEVIESEAEIKDENGNWNRTGNFLVFGKDGKQKVSGEGTCYHIMKDSEGKLYEHKHDVADATNKEVNETVNGEQTLKENNQRIYLPFNQLFTGYGWGVKHIPVYNGEDYAFEGITILDRIDADSVEKFETKFTGDFLYRVGNQNAISIGDLFEAKKGATITSDGVWVSLNKVIEENDVSGTFTPSTTSDWKEGTIEFSGTGIVKITIQDYNYCKPTELIVEVVDATNLTSAKGTTTGGNFVLLGNVNATDYVYYWDSMVYGNGFTYSLSGAPTNYSSSHGHGVIITKNTTLDNLVIVGDVYDEYGAYTNNNDYNAAIDVMGDTVIQNCYISGCSAPVSTRANATITNTTLYGGAVANLLIKGGTVTLDDVTTANYNDNRDAPTGMGIVIHADAAESAELILNGTLTQYNFLNEEDTPSDTYAKNLHTTMFGSALSAYHFGDNPNRRVNTGVVSLTATFNGDDITDNANTGYIGTNVTLSGVNGYVYTQPKTSGSVNNDYDKNSDPHISTTQGAVPPSYSFDHTVNYVAKTDGSNDYCYEENGIVYISMDDGDTFNWNTSILTLGKGLKDYAVSMNGVDYTGKSIAFNSAGDYEVSYAYKDTNNYKIDEADNITTYSEAYVKKVKISVAVIKDTTKHATFTMGSSGVATEKITVDNATYVSATGVTADNSTWSYITIDDQKIYYPIVAAKLTSTTGSSSYAYFPVFENVVTITDYADNGTGDAFTYNSSTTTMPSTLTAVKGIYKAASDVPYWYNLTNSNLTQSGASKIFKWASSSDAPSEPTTYSNVLCYKSPQISADRVAYITLVQYSYTDEANTTYYYYVGYTIEAFTKQNTCFTGDTFVTLADGSKKEAQYLTYDDEFLVWDFVTGDYVVRKASALINHGEDYYNVITLYFADGTNVEIIEEHGFFDVDKNRFVFINESNIAEYIGHNFAKSSADGFAPVKLIGYSVKSEFTTAYSILTYNCENALVEDMLSLTPMPGVDSEAFYGCMVIGKNMTYDQTAIQAYVNKHGLYTFEELAKYDVTYNQYIGANLAYLKIMVGEGIITLEDALKALSGYVPQ